MRVKFTFSDEPDLSAISKYFIYHTYFEFPEQALQLPDCENRVLAISQLIGQLSQSWLHVSCKELDLHNRLIKAVDAPPIGGHSISFRFRMAVVGFERLFVGRSQSRLLKTLNPVEPPWDYRQLPGIVQRRGRRKVKVSMPRALISLRDGLARTPEQAAYISIVEQIRDNVLALLTTQPVYPGYYEQWRFIGFHPYLKDGSLGDLHNKRWKAKREEQRKKEREEKKRLKREEREREKNEAAGKTVRKGQVYFIQQGDDGPIKIGYSTNPEKRLGSLNTASPYPLRLIKVIEGGKSLEREIHQRFSHSQLDGEWFSPTPELLDYIASCK